MRGGGGGGGDDALPAQLAGECWPRASRGGAFGRVMRSCGGGAWRGRGGVVVGVVGTMTPGRSRIGCLQELVVLGD